MYNYCERHLPPKVIL